MNYKRNPSNTEPYTIYPNNKTRIQRITDLKALEGEIYLQVIEQMKKDFKEGNF
ncbi:hypothetical protein AGMMS49942_16970 [Spirochaetia bacterium]|nr:hypothetical protein AGMMS49942_16970 [Spirochaetia bacterium]